MLTANVILKYFREGGWIMWPVAATFFLAFGVVLERTLWWWTLGRSIRQQGRKAARAAIKEGNFDQAWQIGREGPDPFLKTLNSGLANADTSLTDAMEAEALELLERAEARMWVLGTVITLAPLLGLLGTVVGLMGSFASLGDQQLGVSKVTGGIAEALIATACGLGIAIACLLPFNYFRRRVASLRNQLEQWITGCSRSVRSAKNRGHDPGAFALQRQADI